MIIGRAPLRISFSGGGTDLEEYHSKYTGYTISSTINKFTYVMAKLRQDGFVSLNAGQSMVKILSTSTTVPDCSSTNSSVELHFNAQTDLQGHIRVGLVLDNDASDSYFSKERW